MEFRYAEESDAAFLAEINRQLIEDEWDGGGMSLQRLEERMLRWIREDDYTAVLFLEEGATVAYSMVSVDEDSAYIRHFFVLKEHRGKGVGRGLIEAVYERAKEAGGSRVHWLTHESNDTARLLYDRIADRSGFIQYRKIL